MVAMSGKSGLTVSTSLGTTVEIPADTSVMVEEKENGVIRVIQLSGQQTTINVSSKEGTKALSTTAGQEIVIADESTSDEELIPIDGVERIAVAATLKFAGKQVHQNKFDPKRMIDQNKLLNCNQGCFPVYVRNRLNKARAAAAGETKPNNTAQKDSAASTPIAKTDFALRPVAYATPTAAPPASVVSFDSDNATIKHLGAKFSMMTEQEMKLENGEMVIAATKPMLIHGGKFTASLARGAVATVRFKDNVLQVRNVAGSNLHSVSVQSNNHVVEVPIGGEVMIAESAGDLDRSLVDDQVGRRKVKRTEQETAAVLASEISFVSIIQESRLLNKLFCSTEEDDKTISDKIAKTAVALSVVTARHGTYAPLKQ
jgi:hypothetical protein